MLKSREIVRRYAPILLTMALAATANEWRASTAMAQTSPPRQGSTAISNPLTLALRAACTAKNAAATRATILELRSTAMGTGPYVLLGWCIRPDMQFQGRFDDELFGLFIVDPALTRIERTLDMFPTRRWADYSVSIERLTDTEVTIIGHGSYGDQQLRKVYSLRLAK